MPLNDDHRRQIAQFMLIAQHYLSLAAPAGKEGVETLGMTKHDFMPGAPINERTRGLAIIGAHISSAAIRLASVEEILTSANEPNLPYVECRAYFRGEASPQDDDPRASTCSEWFHVMLRDNAAHEEPPSAPTGRRAKRWRIRQNCLENTTFAQAYLRVCEIANSLRTLLTQEHGLSLP